MRSEDLETFTAIAEELSFTVAAERLFLTVSAVSQRVRRLEEELGTRLLERSTRSVALTEHGKILLEGARRRATVDHQIRAAIASSGRVPFSERKLVLGVARVDVSGLINYLTSPQYGAADANWQINTSGSAPESLIGLANRRIDVLLWADWAGLTLSRTSRETIAEMHTETVVYEPLWVYLPEAHPLARQPKVDLADLSTEAWVVGSEELPRQVALSALRTLGRFEPTIACVTDDPRLALDFVRSGKALSFGPPVAEAPLGVVMRPLRQAPIASVNVSVLDAQCPKRFGAAVLDATRAWYFDAARNRNPQYWMWLKSRRPGTQEH